MTSAEEKQQADELTDKIYNIIEECMADYTGGRWAASVIVEQLPQLLYQAGWMPPQTLERVQDWAVRTRDIPEHHINRSVLISHLTELSDILHDR